MKKIIFIFALAILLNSNANATDRDCAQYSSSEAVTATSDDSTNTVSIIFSGMTARKGTTNADCDTASSSEQEVSNNEPAAPAEPPNEAEECINHGGIWTGLECSHDQGGG